MSPESVEVAENHRVLLNSSGLMSLPDFFNCRAGQRLDKPGLESWRQRWRLRLESPDGQGRTFYLKRFERPPLRRQWERWQSGIFRLSAAGIEWQNAKRLARAGICAARPAAFGQQMAGPFELRSCVLLGEVPGESLERWVPQHLPPPDDDPCPAGRRRLLDGLARFIARFHEAGFVHRDLYLSHVFVDPQVACGTKGRDGTDGLFWLIDLQRVFRPRWRSRRWVVKDLAALDLSTPPDRVNRWDRLRFLSRYVRHCSRFGSARLLAAKVGAKSARMARRAGGAAPPAAVTPASRR